MYGTVVDGQDELCTPWERGSMFPAIVAETMIFCLIMMWVNDAFPVKRGLHPPQCFAMCPPMVKERLA